MILRRLFSLTALALAVSLGLNDRANASYDTSVSVASVNAPTGTIGTVPGTNAQGFGTTTSFVNTEFTTGPTTIPTPFGWFAFLDGGGSTIYLVNQVLTGLSNTNGVNESVFVAAAPGTNDNASWTANLLISITNPTQSGAGNTKSFGTGGISETSAFTMSGSAYFPTSLAPPNLFFTPPTSITINGGVFNLFSPGAAGGNANNSNNNGAISASINTIPEPASLVMLGSGLAGVIGLGIRRMRR